MAWAWGLEGADGTVGLDTGGALCGGGWGARPGGGPGAAFGGAKEGIDGGVLAGTADMKEGIDMAAEDEAAPGRGFSSSSLSDPLSLLLELKIKKDNF